MWDYVGIERTDRWLNRAANHISVLEQEVDDYYASFSISKELLELRNLTLVAKLMVESAQHRKESRGLHFNSDYPAMLNNGRDTVLVPTVAAMLPRSYPNIIVDGHLTFTRCACNYV